MTSATIIDRSAGQYKNNNEEKYSVYSQVEKLAKNIAI